MASTLAKIRSERLAKVKKLLNLGITPYPSKGERTNLNKELLDNYAKLEGKEVTVVGRIMSWREHGALRFAHIQDVSDRIQLIIKKDTLLKFDKKEQRLGWNELPLLDIGDYVQAKGKLMKSKTGEVSIAIEDLKILTKAIRPLPEKWEGIKDIETKLRRRYLDMTMDPKTKEIFIKKALFWQYTRDFMNKEGFLEIRTPVLEHTTGGADANPFVTHHGALDTDFYLRISLELPLKRAIGAGFEKVFEIGPVFRNEGIDDEHLQDYDMMEFYWAYANFHDGMKLVENLYKDIAEKTFKTLKFKIRGQSVDLGKKWEEIDYVKTILDKYKIDVIKADDDEIRSKLDELKVKYDKNSQKARLIDALWKQIRQEVAGPVFLVNQPKFVSPLAKSNPANPDITERYQVIIAGSEVGNGYSELNDPVDQYERFINQQKLRDLGDAEAQMLDIDFVEMLEYGMPPTTGFGVSERLFSFLVDKPIRQTVMFPQMRRELESTTKEIYGLKDISEDIETKVYDKKKVLKPKTKKKKFNELAKIKPGITREKALKLVRKHTKNENLVKHMLASESAMREYAKHYAKEGKLYKNNVEAWALAGLLHDIMFEEDPEGHMFSGAELLKKEGVSDYITHAIEVHGNNDGSKHITHLDKVLLVTEECTGLVVAATLVLPSKKLKDLKLESLVKRFGEKGFAAKLDRENITSGCERIGKTVEEHLCIVLKAMKGVSDELGL